MFVLRQRFQRTPGNATPRNSNERTEQNRSMTRTGIQKKSKMVEPRRKSKRIRSRATPSPKNFEEMLKQAESLARESIYAEACAGKIKHEGPPFRLLDLPPELRMQIFDYMVSRPYPLQLRNLVAPLITAISKQVRAECMAGFFALNTFQMVVETNICLLEHIRSFEEQFGSLQAATQQPHLHPIDLYWLDLLYRLESRAGGMHIEANTEDWLRKINRNVAVFRNIEVILNDTLDDPALCVSDPIGLAAIQLAWMIKFRTSPKGREIFTVSMWHPMQLVPHFVSRRLDLTTARNYYDYPMFKFGNLLDMNHPSFDTFNFDALEALAHAVGHWGRY